MEKFREFDYWINEINLFAKVNGFSNGIKLIENALNKGKISYLDYLKYKQIFNLWKNFKNGGELLGLINEEVIENLKDIRKELKNLI